MPTKIQKKTYTKPNYHSQNKKNPPLLLHKKIKLRTSLNIYHRLLHDKTLNIDLKNVLIGYNDNISGIQEICILNWVLIDQGGDIPMHHIIYFIFISNNKRISLWDRKIKLDRLYGSGFTKPCQLLKHLNIININHTLNDNNNDDDNEEKKQTQKTCVIKFSNNMSYQYFPQYPTTLDGFVESFAIKETLKWLSCLDKFGFVVLKNVLTENECNLTIDSMFNEIYSRTILRRKICNDSYIVNKININNPYTWNGSNFPKPHAPFLTQQSGLTKQAFINRCNDKIYFIFQNIFNNNHKLNVNIGSFGVQRGTKNLICTNPITKERTFVSEKKKWRVNLCEHWDINPWEYIKLLESGYYEYIYQGAIALNNQSISDGTHINLPGCIHYLKRWCNTRKYYKTNGGRYNINSNDSIIKYMQPIPLRKGEMIIWNFGQLHGNTKNYSSKMRLSQYLRVFPAQKKYTEKDKTSVKNTMKRYPDVNVKLLLEKYNLMNDKTFKLLGLKKY